MYLVMCKFMYLWMLFHWISSSSIFFWLSLKREKKRQTNLPVMNATCDGFLILSSSIKEWMFKLEKEFSIFCFLRSFVELFKAFIRFEAVLAMNFWLSWLRFLAVNDPPKGETLLVSKVSLWVWLNEDEISGVLVVKSDCITLLLRKRNECDFWRVCVVGAEAVVEALEVEEFYLFSIEELLLWTKLLEETDLLRVCCDCW